MRVLIVRPAPGNAATAAAVAAMGLEPVVVPLFEVVSRAWDAPDAAAFDAVVMTSANAARHGGAGLAAYTHLPLFAVGEATAKAGEAAGFDDIRLGSGDASDLSELLKPLPFRGRVGVGAVPQRESDLASMDLPHPNPSPEGEGLRVLHLTGSDHRPLQLTDNVTVIPIYESRTLDPVAPLGADIALVHSPRAAARLAELITSKPTTHLVAISSAAATAAGPGWAAVHMADIPREHAMLAVLARVCEAARESD